ncbi:hypothetical protein NDU88_005891 [Pleurodeles waltl]|uniref:Uncharacterized protein n=1 Tax=Pleurodeles waltl TaxID=8319 RepID=A0AAV7RJZ8_PLEWA|nr:hypothetical protein NDU88_005891 [Pleurodeles waltl]
MDPEAGDSNMTAGNQQHMGFCNRPAGGGGGDISYAGCPDDVSLEETGRKKCLEKWKSAGLRSWRQSRNVRDREDFGGGDGESQNEERNQDPNLCVYVQQSRGAGGSCGMHCHDSGELWHQASLRDWEHENKEVVGGSERHKIMVGHEQLKVIKG